MSIIEKELVTIINRQDNDEQADKMQLVHDQLSDRSSFLTRFHLTKYFKR